LAKIDAPLIIGDKVKMVNCFEAKAKKNMDKVWEVRSMPWKLMHGEEVVLLEGRSGGFATKYLQKIG